jgi:hypothetical protein
VDAEKRETKLRAVTVQRFGLTQREVNLARGFFEKTFTNCSDTPLYKARGSTSFSELKNVFTFTEYKYDNGHRGVYPLDTNSAGVLR